MRRIRSLLSVSPARRALALEALLALVKAWALVRFRPFKAYAGRLGQPLQGEKPDLPPADLSLLRDLRWAVGAVNKTVGGRFTCLMQAMAAKEILNRRGVSNALVLGARRGAPEELPAGDAMAAHAWLWAGERIILGGEGREGFIPVASYRSG